MAAGTATITRSERGFSIQTSQTPSSTALFFRKLFRQNGKVSDLLIKKIDEEFSEEDQSKQLSPQRKTISWIKLADECEFDPNWKAIAKECYASKEFTQHYLLDVLRLFRPISKFLDSRGHADIQAKGEARLSGKREDGQLKLMASIIVAQQELFKEELYALTVERAKEFLKAKDISITE